MKNPKQTFIFLLAMIGVIAPLSMLRMLINKEIEPTPLVSGFIGMLLSSYPLIFQYYFGSSSGSRDKQDTIDKMTATIPPVPDADLEARKNLWKDSGSTLSFEDWTKFQKAWKDSGSTLTFDQWIEEQKKL